jgi:hypothetical protein
MISAISSYGLFSTWRRMTAVLYSGRSLVMACSISLPSWRARNLAFGVGGVG